MTTAKPLVFFSYAREDKKLVEDIYDQLNSFGVKLWMDVKDILPGQKWEQTISKALIKSEFVVVFFSSNSVSKRGYIQKEFKLALSTLDMFPDDDIFIIPVRLDNCVIPQRFAHLQYTDWFVKGSLEQILKAITSRENKEANSPIQAKKHFNFGSDSLKIPKTRNLKSQEYPINKVLNTLRENDIENAEKKLLSIQKDYHECHNIIIGLASIDIKKGLRNLLKTSIDNRVHQLHRILQDLNPETYKTAYCLVIIYKNEFYDVWEVPMPKNTNTKYDNNVRNSPLIKDFLVGMKLSTKSKSEVRKIHKVF
ncbi:MAG: toll/interleukin-1 receptor domain-containing protein [Calditrichia bacterium]